MQLPDLIATLVALGGTVAGPADPARLMATTQALFARGLVLPGEYAKFLSLADGLWWNGIHLAGASLLPRPKAPPAADLATLAARHPGLGLIVGGSDEDLYAADSGEWRILDKSDGAVMAAFPTLEALLEHVIAERV